MIVTEKYLRFEGIPSDALAFVNAMREAQETGLEYPKVFNDFMFSIEVALQNEGMLDEDFNPVGNWK